jgi:uncharacterized membrane protein YdjX (TVP38/TMEM64 family)
MRSSRDRWLLLACLLAAIAGVFWFLPTQTYLEQFLAVVRELGLWGLVLLGAAYTPASLVLFPGSVLTLTAAGLYDFWPALIAVSLGSTLAAVVVFLTGRTLLRTWVEEWVRKYPRFHALDRAVAGQGFKIVLLTRLSPVFPYTLLNYAFSLTRVSFRDYFLATWLGMIPGTVMYVYLGQAAKSLGMLVKDLWTGQVENLGQTLFLFAGFVATVLVTVLVTRLARQALAAKLDAADAPSEPTS